MKAQIQTGEITIDARIAAALTAAFLILPAGASASTVSLTPGGDEEPPTILYDAAAGEANRLEITVSGSTADVRDNGAGSIVVGQNCTQVNAKRATCSLPSATAKITAVAATLRDGNDTADAGGASADVDGGPGNDTLRGSELADILRGATGTDTLRGEAGPDTLSDGDVTGAANRDTLDGGPDLDFAEYSARTAPVTVDLADNAGDGEQGENDDLNNVENVTGGQAGDTIRGTDGPNILQGLAGDDTIEGRGGNDYLGGSDGNDTLVGAAGTDDIEAGGGNDTLRLENPAGEFDRLLTCGGGKDTIVGLTARPSVAIDCEIGDLGFTFVVGLKPKKVTRESVTLKIPCPDIYRANGRCKGSVVVEPSGAYARTAEVRKDTRYGAKSFAISGSSAKVTIPLNSRGRKQLRKSAFKLQFTINLKETATKTKRRFEWTSYLVRSFL